MSFLVQSNVFFTGFTCHGIWNDQKYKHSATELLRKHMIPASLKAYGPCQLTSGIVHRNEQVTLSFVTSRISTLQLAHICQMNLSQFLYKPETKIEIPFISIIDTFQLPSIRDTVDSTYDRKYYIEAPTHDGLIQKQAARLIVIRRRKMKKHKLKKLRKKMKFEWAKVRQRREMRKEKAFQAVLIAQIKQAEKFDAEKYVAERLQEVHKVPLPRTWKGKRLPFFIIKQKLGIK
jgi:hypothetical protein